MKISNFRLLLLIRDGDEVASIDGKQGYIEMLYEGEVKVIISFIVIIHDISIKLVGDYLPDWVFAFRNIKEAPIGIVSLMIRQRRCVSARYGNPMLVTVATIN